ncbi:hypothetical protein Pmar_PMAR024138 [Perkinsus marinus ATCC 50983]|uniref:Uncharacterized protein n=1 Tax=Perkinsus marinus (strain ATCC 50983 / TXsc) TaxID=423536 RepID=C5L2A2_PERM5|nr:hypothetical protein Pmar_PMAR024138 [Perkinsus marinus ATCC 50983]EER09114.1 hypothetical protein Pmar_PMAR024138 [Perkinsus marinus ATCC 50983]|eukprot:XP_002777298.1 hypothetical protein Pmar_PMAR024138 [Perkinsus marinus ATCC 50983]
MGNKRGERRKRMNARQECLNLIRDGKKLEDGIQAKQSPGTAVCVQAVLDESPIVEWKDSIAYEGIAMLIADLECTMMRCDYTSKELEKTRCNLIQALNAHKSELQARQQAEDDAEVQKKAARVADERAMQLEERIQARDGEVFTFKLDL